MDSDIEMSQTVGSIGTKTINIGMGGGSDVEAGIEFIYNMREHMLDIGIATVYLFTCYAIYLWLKRLLQP